MITQHAAAAKLAIFFLSITAFNLLLGNSITDAQSQSPLFMMDGLQFLHNVNVDTGVQTDLGPLDTNAPIGLADYQGGLWTVDLSNRLLELDQTNGQIINSVSINGENVFGEGSLAIRNDGTAFISDSSGLTQISLATGQASALGMSSISFNGMDFDDATGTLFAISMTSNPAVTPDLYTIDTTTGDATLIGTTGVSLGPGSLSTSGLTFNENGELYWSINRRLYTIDTTTGQAELQTGLSWGGAPSGAWGLSFVNPVPEPSSVILLSMIGLVAIRRTR